jgi:hypothetical protein
VVVPIIFLLGLIWWDFANEELVSYAEAIQIDLDNFVPFRQRIGGLFYGPNFDQWWQRMTT